MDLSFLQALIPNVAAWFHVDPATVIFFLGIIISTCNFVGRIIPDDATGWRYYVRRLCKLIGLYVPNRVTDGIDTSKAAAIALDHIESQTSRKVNDIFASAVQANDPNK